MDDIQRLKDFINRDLLSGGAPDLAAEDNLLTSGMIDSMGMMRLIAFIEDSFAVKVPPEDVTIEHFATLRDIQNYVNRLRAA